MFSMKKANQETPTTEEPQEGESIASSAEAQSKDSSASSIEENSTDQAESSTNTENLEQSNPPEAEGEKVEEKSITYDDWLQNTVINFLDIADMPSLHDRRAALIATKMDEEALVARFNLAESLFTVEYAYACEVNDKNGIERVELYRGKASTLKSQMGLK